jgi:hypothetical protein
MRKLIPAPVEIARIFCEYWILKPVGILRTTLTRTLYTVCTVCTQKSKEKKPPPSRSSDNDTCLFLSCNLQ